MRPLLLVLILLVLVPLPAPARTTLDNPAMEVLRQRKKALRLERGRQRQAELVAAATAKEAKVLEELEAINRELAASRQRLAERNQELAEVRQRLAEVQAETARLEEALAASREHVGRRLTALHRTGRTGLLNILFTASTVTDLATYEEYYRRMVAHDRQALARYRQQLAALARQRTTLERQQAAVAAVAAQAAAEERRLDEVRRRQEALLARLASEKDLYRRALAELERASRQLQQRLAALTREAASPPSAVPAVQGPPVAAPLPPLHFADRRGRLAAPVSGTVVSLFGKSSPDRFGVVTDNEGIDILARPAAPVRAIYHGRVLYVGFLRGYGNLMIIDHGDHYYSLLSRVETFYKKKGETVTTGEIVGILGEEAGVRGRGLHLEIRHNTTPLDPLDWLAPGQLTVATGKSPE